MRAASRGFTRLHAASRGFTRLHAASRGFTRLRAQLAQRPRVDLMKVLSLENLAAVGLPCSGWTVEQPSVDFNHDRTPSETLGGVVVAEALQVVTAICNKVICDTWERYSPTNLHLTLGDEYLDMVRHVPMAAFQKRGDVGAEIHQHVRLDPSLG